MDLHREIEKYSHYFNSYIIAKNITKRDIEISITNILYNKFFNNEHFLFFLSHYAVARHVFPKFIIIM